MNTATKNFWMTQKKQTGWRIGPFVLYLAVILWIVKKSFFDVSLYNEENGLMISYGGERIFEDADVVIRLFSNTFQEVLVSQRTFYLIGVIYLGLAIPYVFIQAHHNVRGNSVIEIAKVHPFDADTYFRSLWKAYLPYYVIGGLIPVISLIVRFDPLFLGSSLIVLLIPPLVFLGQKAVFIRLMSREKRSFSGVLLEFLLAVSYCVVLYVYFDMCYHLITELMYVFREMVERRFGMMFWIDP